MVASRMIVLLCFFVIFAVLGKRCTGQWNMGPEFHSNMNHMVSNLNNMAVNLQQMGDQLARQQEAKVAHDMRRAQAGVPFGNDGMVFITAKGGLGYAYNSSIDGSFTLYSLGSGSPPNGYMYHMGPAGTSYRSW